MPAGARTSLTCVARGSPPISYRWFRAVPGGTALPLSSQAELTWDSLRPSDAGTYYCEAENRVGAGAVQRSDAVELVVRGESPACSSSPRWQEPVRQMVPVCPGISHVALNVNRVWIAAQEGSPALPLALLTFAWLGTRAGSAANRLMSGLSHRVPSHTATHAWDQPAHRTPTHLGRQRGSPRARRWVTRAAGKGWFHPAGMQMAQAVSETSPRAGPLGLRILSGEGQKWSLLLPASRSSDGGGWGRAPPGQQPSQSLEDHGLGNQGSHSFTGCRPRQEPCLRALRPGEP